MPRRRRGPAQPGYLDAYKTSILSDLRAGYSPEEIALRLYDKGVRTPWIYDGEALFFEQRRLVVMIRYIASKARGWRRK